MHKVDFSHFSLALQFIHLLNARCFFRKLHGFFLTVIAWLCFPPFSSDRFHEGSLHQLQCRQIELLANFRRDPVHTSLGGRGKGAVAL